MLEELIPIFGIAVRASAVPLSIPIVWIALNYRKRRRLMELHHAERMAAIERGMDIPPLPIELIDGRSPPSAGARRCCPAWCGSSSASRSWSGMMVDARRRHSR